MTKCNKEESVRWKNIAERMMQENDFLLARKLIISAQNNFDDTEISKMLIVCDVQCSAERKLTGDVMNWYEIIQVDQTADEAAINKQFKKFARQLHTDKNRFPGADAAFKLVSEARRVLLDKKKRLLFDKKYKASLVKPSTIFKEVVREEMAACSSSADTNQPKEKISLTFSTSCPFSDVWKKFIFKRAMGSQNCSKGFDAYDLDNTRSWQASKMKQTPFPQEPSASKKGFDSNSDFGAVQSKDDNVEKTLPTYEGGLKKSSGERKRKEVLESGKSSFTEKSSGKRKRKEMSEPIESGDSEIDANAGDDVIDDQYIDFLNRLKLGSAFELIDEADNIKCESPLTKPATSHGRGSCRPSGSGDSNLINESIFANIGQPELPNGSLTFLTVCPCCTIKTECHKSIMKKALRCQNCNKSFIAYDDCGHCKRKRNKDNNDKYFETGQNSGSKLLRRSRRLLEKFYNEILDDGDDDQHGDVDEVVMISDDDDDDEEEEEYMLPLPDFNDFDKKRGEDCFRVNQIWALYDSLDTMPRFYALIKEVMFLPRSSIRITWLEAEPENESETKWVDEGLPIGCGKFKVGASEDIEGFSKFSHLVSCKIEGGEDTCTIIPMKGEIWALFKDWNINWKFDTNPYGKYEYEIVEILSDYNEGGIGTSVAYLSKVKGFVSVFRRTVCDDGASTFLIPLSQRFRFAHRVLYFELNGEEREGVLRGSFELDPASLPDSILHVHPYKDLKVAGAVRAVRPKNPCFSLKTTSILQQLHLEIPRSYLVRGAALSTTIFLRLSTGLVWQVKLSEEGKHVCFTDGWQEFVEYSALTVRHLVLFEHSESNVFNVRVLANKDTEIEYPLDNVVDIKPQDTLSGDNHDFTTNPSYAAQESRGNTRTVQPRQAALDEGMDFKSDYKFFKITIWPSYTARVGRGGGVGLPKSFVMEYIDKSEFIQMTLKVGEESWNVLAHTRTGKKSSCQIQTGWAPFARDNDLKLNDICFFEVTRKGNPAELTVSIFRAAGV